MKEKDVIYEDVLTIGLTQPLVDTGIDYIEMGVEKKLSTSERETFLANYNSNAKDSLDEMEKQKEPYHAMYGNVFDSGMSILLSCGIAINQAHHFFVNILGILIHQYGIKADFSHSVEEIKKSTWVGMEHTIENGWAPISNKK